MALRLRPVACPAILLALAFVLFSPSVAADLSAPASSDKTSVQEYAPQRIIVAFKTDLTMMMSSSGRPVVGVGDLDSLNVRFGVERMEPLFAKKPAKGIAAAGVQAGDACVLTYSDKADPLVVAAAYAELPQVRYAEPDRIRRVLRVDPNDPYWPTSNSWGQGYRDQWDMELIDCPDAWDVNTGNPSLIVAVSDTGIDYNHADIAANMWCNPGEIPGNGVDDDGNGYVDDYYGYDFANGDSNPMDGNGHGTHCAGTIGAVGNNSIGIAGINWNCKLMAVKGLDDGGSGYDSTLATGIRYAADQGARVISMSWGGAGFSQTIHDALAYAHGLGAVLCVAGGNSWDDIARYSPASDNYAITVSATDQNDQACSFTNWGVKTAVSAPGGNGIGSTPPCAQYNCLSLRAGTTDLLASGCGAGVGVVGGNYYRLAGTSMACPHVSGVAALVMAQHPEWTNEQVRQAIQMRADDILSSGFDRYAGFGRLNAYRSVTSPEPLAAFISYPWNGGEISGLAEIRGTVTGPGLSDWSLDYGVGYEPSSWTTIATGTAPVASGVIANWDVSEVAGGMCTLRLRANGAGSVQNAEYRLAVTPRTTEGSGHFTEFFDNMPFDLAGRSLNFTPDGSAGFYSLCVEPITQLPTDPAGGSPISLGDDASYQATLPAGTNVSVYGYSSNVFFVGSNGYVTLGASDSSYSESVGVHFSLRRISALFDDLDPGAGGSISWKQLSDRVAVTWQNVPQYGLSDSNTFQIEMYLDGRITISYLGISSGDALVGLSEGLGVPDGFAESDLSAYPACVILGRELRIARPNGGEWYEPGNTMRISWTVRGIDWVPGDTVALFRSSDGGSTWTAIPGAGNLPYGSGYFDWATTGIPQSGQYRVQVRYNGDPSILASSHSNFTVMTDTIAPVITHLPLADTANAIGPYTVCATVTDNMGVASVILSYSKNSTTFTSIPMNPTGIPGQYCAAIPGPSVVGDRYCYYIEAVDISAAQNDLFTPDYCFSIASVVALPIDLIDGDGYLWDIQRSGQILNGVIDAFDGGFALAGFPDFSTAATEDGGREIVIGPASLGGISVVRKIYVPASRAYCRFLEVVTNPGASPVLCNLQLSTNLGSDSSTVVVGTSDGDTAFESGDLWIVTDDYDGSGDPTVTHVVCGAGAPLVPDPVSISVDQISYRYALNLAPGETKIVMHFGAQSPNQVTALERAPQISGLSPAQDCLAGMTPAEISQLANFLVGGRTLMLTAPNGGEFFEPGAVIPVRWSAYGVDWQPADTVRLEYSADGGVGWNAVPGASGLLYSSGSFDWPTSGAPQSSQYRMRVLFEGDLSVCDTSNADFTVAVDSVPPVIDGTPLTDTRDHTGPYEICATVTDNQGVGAVTLYWMKNGGEFTSTPMALSGIANKYCAEIPGPSEDGDIYCYHITAADVAGIPNTSRGPSAGECCFHILDCRPPVPTNPSPADGAVGVPVDTPLTWDMVEGSAFRTLGTGPNWLVVGNSTTNIAEAAAALGATVTTTQNFTAAPLDGIDVVIFGIDISAGRFSRDQTTKTKLANFVSSGGGLYVELGGDASFMDYSWVPTDGIVSSELTSIEYVSIAAPDHPIAEGVTDAGLDEWGNSAHGVFTSTAGLDVVFTESSSGLPVLIAGTYGMGSVVYTNVDPVYSHSGNPETQDLVLRNCLRFAADGGLPQATYDLYVGLSCDSLTQIASGLSGPAYEPPAGWLEATTHYWKIVVNNTCGSTEGPCWSFTTTADATSPAISHTPLQNTLDHEGPYRVCASVADNLAVGNVMLYWSKNGGAFTGVPMQPDSALSTPAEYCAEIPGPSEDGDTYCYYITATDVAGIPNTSREPAVGEHCFDILSCRPPAPSDPIPADGAVGVSVGTHLSWNTPPPPPLAASAEQLTVDAYDRGWWNNLGVHDQYNKNTYTGKGDEKTYRSYLAFDLSSLSRLITAATLRVEIERYFSADPSESVVVYDVSTPISVLTASGENVAVFSDLGTGNSYGGFTVIPTDVGSVLQITLSGEALNDINAALGGRFAVGLSLSSIAGYSSQEAVRFSWDVEPRVHQLVLTMAQTTPTVFDVYMGPSCAEMTRIAQDLPVPTCDPGPLTAGSTYFWRVVARNSCGETAGPCWSFSTETTRINKPADGALVDIHGAIVSAAFPGCFYTQTASRECGVRVQMDSHGLTAGKRIDIRGTMHTNSDGERYIAPSGIALVGIGSASPLRMCNRAVGGANWLYDSSTNAGQQGVHGSLGLNNIGLLVRIAGKVTERGRDWFYVDDGSSVQDGTGITGVYCEVPLGVATPAAGSWVFVTGVSSCEFYGGKLVNVLLVRDQHDIAVLSPTSGATGLAASSPDATRPRDIPKAD